MLITSTNFYQPYLYYISFINNTSYQCFHFISYKIHIFRKKFTISTEFQNRFILYEHKIYYKNIRVLNAPFMCDLQWLRSVYQLLCLFNW